MTDTLTESGPSGALASDQTRLASLVKLKDYAVSRGYDVSITLLDGINELRSSAASQHSGKSDKFASKLDELIIALTQVTFPVTIQNVKLVTERTRPTPFVYILLVIGLLAVLSSSVLSWMMNDPRCAAIAKHLLPLCLGVVGAIVYVMLPNGRLNTVIGLDADDVADTLVRVFMGGLLGYVLYIAGTAVIKPTSQHELDWLLLLPLLGGYSITLVVGILSKAVAAFQLTFNIDEKSVRASLQK